MNMELKDKIDIIDKKAGIANKKLIAFLAIAGGTWLYGINDKNMYVTIVGSIGFFMALVGIAINILKLSELQNKLKGLDNERFKLFIYNSLNIRTNSRLFSSKKTLENS